jgi:hypothetical protein
VQEQLIPLLVAQGLVDSVEDGRRLAAEDPGMLERLLLEQQEAAFQALEDAAGPARQV